MGNIIRSAGALVLFGLIAACGGGGGGGGGGAGGGGGSSTPLVYTGNTAPAIITTANAAKLVAKVIGSDSSSSTGISASLSSSSSGSRIAIANLARRLNQGFGDTLSQQNTRAIVVNSTDPCDGDSGSVQTVGTLTDDGIGTLTLTYRNCLSGGDTLNGQVTVRIDAAFPSDITYGFSTLSLRGPSGDLTIGGTLRSQDDTITNTLTANVVSRDNSTGAMTKSENLVIVDRKSGAGLTETISGRLFDSLLGFVDVTTLVPFVFEPATTDFPKDGSLRIIGANSNIRVTAISAVAVALDLDLDGNNSFDISVVLPWRDLTTAVGSDLADTDHDGMHNSWEIAHRLNPLDPSDATADNDGDGFTNLKEYQTGVDPHDPSSRPVGANLAVFVSGAVNPVVTGGTFDYTVSVSNLGPDTAVNLQVNDVLPPGVSVVSIFETRWTCNQQGSAITCTLPELPVGFPTFFTIHVQAPSATGTLTNTATLTSGTFDTNNANNTATVQTQIVLPTADLQLTGSRLTGVVVGDNVTYTMDLFNGGPNDAPNVVITDTLPAGATVVSASATQGACSGTGPIVCNLGTVRAFVPLRVTLVARLGTAGIFRNTATISSGIGDPDPSNNTVSTLTGVGQAASDIQTLIDNAPAGSTITVDPGIYVGGLNFNGKDVVLQSRDGPASTTLFANGQVGVRAGPAGTIRGFTITAANGDFGAGVAVSGAGTLVSGNIFDGNGIPGAPGIGIGVGGINASPTIERNVFRNNGCDTQLGSSVVSLELISSPLIVNNIFEDNVCAGVKLDPLAGTAWRVYNNTFVRNRTAVTLIRSVSLTAHVFRNNLIVQNGTGVQAQFDNEAYNPVWENNLVYGNTTDHQGIGPLTGTSGNISADPLFVNAATGDYRLQAGSPAIDAGSATNAPAIDFAGTSRPRGAGIDIGAFEAP